MCVCCSWRSQRNPPIPQDSAGTSCQSQAVQIRLLVLPSPAVRRAEAPVPPHCSTLQASGHILMSSHSSGGFWHSKKLLLSFKGRNGKSEKRIPRCGAKPKPTEQWHLISNRMVSLEILYVRAAWHDLCAQTCKICSDLTDPNGIRSQQIFRSSK